MVTAAPPKGETETEGGQDTVLNQSPAQKTLTLRPPEAFDDGFAWAPNADDAARDLIQEFQMVAGKFRVRCAWKEKGGNEGGVPRVGWCQVNSAATRWITGVDAIIWLAADHCKDMPPEKIEACIFHQLLHIGETEGGSIANLPHEFSGFLKELDVVGCHTQDLSQAKAHFESAQI